MEAGFEKGGKEGLSIQANVGKKKKVKFHLTLNPPEKPAKSREGERRGFFSYLHAWGGGKKKKCALLVWRPFPKGSSNKKIR